ncbi:SIMPL domain-containing protein [Sediminibacillus massiliensis]|uniref:SIMPL domain-containing protein n=1 Tax=Sediminibacillus massiliensis TaxID=1926277 RepID=UPI0009889322|nr:SIMPL domain-containing protein [Sediminibacillus massiliensis]
MYYPPMRAQEKDPPGKMRMEGSAQTLLQVDIATLQLGVLTVGDELTQVRLENSEQTGQVIQSLLNLGIEEANIQTAAYHIHPVYDFVDNIQVFRGYEVTHMLSVKVVDIEQVGSAVDIAVQHGANQISGIQFGVSEPMAYYRQLLNEAMDNASTKARALAQSMNLQLNPIPVKINEVPDGGSMLGEYMTTGVYNTSIRPGQLELTARVVVEFIYY